jgi:hypothetical protein
LIQPPETWTISRVAWRRITTWKNTEASSGAGTSNRVLSYRNATSMPRSSSVSAWMTE